MTHQLTVSLSDEEYKLLQEKARLFQRKPTQQARHIIITDLLTPLAISQFSGKPLADDTKSLLKRYVTECVADILADGPWVREHIQVALTPRGWFYVNDSESIPDDLP